MKYYQMYEKLLIKLIFLILIQVSWEDRYSNWSHSVPVGIVDVKVCPIWQPRNNAWEYLTGRNEFGLKYEIVCSIGYPKIISIKSPFKGAANDAMIADVSGIKDMLGPHECLLADKMYQHDHISFIKPLQGHRYTLPSDENAFNYLVYSARSTVKRIIFSTCSLWYF